MGLNFIQVICELREEIGQNLKQNKTYTELEMKRDTIYKLIEDKFPNAWELFNELLDTETQLTNMQEESFLLTGMKLGFELSDIIKIDKPFFESIKNIS